jgi:hypothetical protein
LQGRRKEESRGEVAGMPRKSQTNQGNSKSVGGKVKARTCRHCGHHEIGIITEDGKFVALKQGDKVVLIED